MRTSGKKTLGVFEPPKHKEEAAIKEELQKEAENDEPKPNENNNYSEHASNISEIESKKNEDQQESQGGHIASDVT